MARPFGIEREFGAIMTNRHDPSFEGVPFKRPGPALCLIHGATAISRPQRVAGKCMKDVGKQQFLVLLFVLDAQLDKIQSCDAQRTKRRLDHRIDMSAIADHFGQRRPRDHPAPRTQEPLSFGFVIAVEQERPGIVKQRVARNMVAQNEGFKEPSCMAQMPLGGRGIRHGLDCRIGIAQPFGKRKGQFARLAKEI